MFNIYETTFVTLFFDRFCMLQNKTKTQLHLLPLLLPNWPQQLWKTQQIRINENKPSKLYCFNFTSVDGINNCKLFIIIVDTVEA